MIRNSLLYWLSQFDNIQFVSDVCHYDMVLLIDLLADTALDLPNNISAVCIDINQLIAKYNNISDKDAFNLSREEFLLSKSITIEGKKHNALYDAKVIQAIYNIVK